MLEEAAPICWPAPTSRYDDPLYAKPRVQVDHHIEVSKALAPVDFPRSYDTRLTTLRLEAIPQPALLYDVRGVNRRRC